MAIRIWKDERNLLEILLRLNKSHIPDTYYININRAVIKKSSGGHIIPNDACLSNIPRKTYCCISCLKADFNLKRDQLATMHEN